MNFRTVTDLNDAIVRRLPSLPRDLDLVVGIPRSGMLAASLIALHLNLPLTDVDGFIAGRMYPPGRTRASFLKHRDVADCRTVLVVDDSISTGVQMDAVRQALAGASVGRRIVFGAVYATPEAVSKVDLPFDVCPAPRMFEWNFYHSSNLRDACMDIDGVLCRDPTPEENDDGARYLAFLENVEPIRLPTLPVGYLVTCRLEKYRGPTEAWLARHGVKHDHLLMMNLPDKAARQRSGAHAAYKANHYRSTGTAFFIESSLAQATEIADRACKPVFCTESRTVVFPGALSIGTSLAKKTPGYVAKRARIASSRLGSWLLRVARRRSG